MKQKLVKVVLLALMLAFVGVGGTVQNVAAGPIGGCGYLEITFYTPQHQYTGSTTRTPSCNIYRDGQSTPNCDVIVNGNFYEYLNNNCPAYYQNL